MKTKSRIMTKWKEQYGTSWHILAFLVRFLSDFENIKVCCCCFVFLVRLPWAVESRWRIGPASFWSFGADSDIRDSANSVLISARVAVLARAMCFFSFAQYVVHPRNHPYSRQRPFIHGTCFDPSYSWLWWSPSQKNTWWIGSAKPSLSHYYTWSAFRQCQHS